MPLGVLGIYSLFISIVPLTLFKKMPAQDVRVVCDGWLVPVFLWDQKEESS